MALNKEQSSINGCAVLSVTNPCWTPSGEVLSACSGTENSRAAVMSEVKIPFPPLGVVMSSLSMLIATDREDYFTQSVINLWNSLPHDFSETNNLLSLLKGADA